MGIHKSVILINSTSQVEIHKIAVYILWLSFAVIDEAELAETV